MTIKDQTVVQCTIVNKTGYCPVFDLEDKIFIKKHCLDFSQKSLEKYCYYTIADLYPIVMKMRKMPIGAKELFKCKDNGIIEIEIERIADEPYDFENH